MEWFKKWLQPVVAVVAWVAVLSYTVSMVATVEPTLRQVAVIGERDVQVNL